MINKGQVDAEELKIQGLLDRYLRFRSSNNNFSVNENHLDEDSLTAFVEGRVTEPESPSIIKHLIDCSFCLHVTSELVKMHEILAENEILVSIPTKEPTKVSEVLSGIFSRIFGSGDSAVFAHEEKNETEEETEEDK